MGSLGHREFWLQIFLYLMIYKETVGSLKFPSYPFEYMPWSQTTVVSTALVLAHRELLPSIIIRMSAFPSLPSRERVYPMTTIP